MYKTVLGVYNAKDLTDVFRKLKILLNFWNLLYAFTAIVICLKVTAIKKHFVIIY